WTADAPGGSRPTAAATAAARHRPALLAVLAVAALAAVAILFRTLGPPADRPRSRDAPRAAGAGAPAPATAGAAGAAAGGADRPAVSPDAAAGGADGGTAPASVLPADQTTAGAPQPAGAPAAADAGTQAIPPGTAPAGGATTEIAGRQEEERGARADGGEATGSGSPGGATGAGVARALPAAELRQLGGELAAESGKLRDLYADFLSKKEKAGRRLTANDDKLKDEIKELQRAAEGFGAPFQTGFWARARNRLGRFGRSEDPNAQITRLARALAGSGARADALMAQVKPDPAVRQLWRHIRRQCRRVAEICGV
ncbi:MAG TPA: hypothetical protein VMW75_13795, partial [Thermoanaerobaculia bacterium]|nr:hypothetical protein [Thermoanaerobaculia bacterium]